MIKGRKNLIEFKKLIDQLEKQGIVELKNLDCINLVILVHKKIN